MAIRGKASFESDELTPALRRMLRSFARGMKPPPKLTISQWADRERVLSSDTAAEPGRWRTSRFEPQREVMDSITHNQRTVVMKAAQLGFTELILNACGYYMEQDPSSILVVQPNVQPMANDFSVDRLGPMIRDTPSLRKKLGNDKSRDTSKTKLNKTFPGGNISITGANSPTGLRSKPKRCVFFDEVDGYGLSSGREGDPILLGTKRAANFHNRRIVLISTPTIKGLSRIEKEFEKSDKRYFHIACPYCHFEHILKWPNVVWDDKDPATARFRCPNCEQDYSNAQKNLAVRKGRWIATAPWKGVAGFHVSELYSSWRTIHEIVNDWLESDGDLEQRQVFINTVLGELWEEGGTPLDEHALAKRCESYGGEIPDRVLVLTAGVDMQPDRLEVEVVGWAAGNESWSIDYRVFHGNPDIPEGEAGSPWDKLTSYLRKKWNHPLYGDMAISATCLDTGGAGTNTQSAYEYLRRHKGDKFYGIKGRGGDGVPVIGRPSKAGTGKQGKRPIDLYTVGTDTAKSIIYRALRIDTPGAGYCHFPIGREVAYFQQLTAEKIVTTYVKGFPKRRFECPKGKRNEALDCRVYAFAALTNLSPQYDKIAFRLKQRAKPLPKRPEAPKLALKASDATPPEENRAEEKIEEIPERRRKTPARRRRGGFVSSW